MQNPAADQHRSAKGMSDGIPVPKALVVVPEGQAGPEACTGINQGASAPFPRELGRNSPQQSHRRMLGPRSQQCLLVHGTARACPAPHRRAVSPYAANFTFSMLPGKVF